MAKMRKALAFVQESRGEESLPELVPFLPYRQLTSGLRIFVGLNHIPDVMEMMNIYEVRSP